MKNEIHRKTNKSVKNNFAKTIKPTDDELANRWINEHPDEVFGLGCFREYDQGAWIGRPSKEIDSEILNILKLAKGENVRPAIGRVTSVKKLIEIMINVPDKKWDKMTNYLPLQNGLLNLDSYELIPHAPENYLTSTLPYKYDPTAEPRYWLKALSTLPKDVREFLQEFAGYCLTSDTHFEIGLILYGPSGCGKSTIISGLQAVLGSRSCSLSLRDIETSRFNLPILNGKTLMVATEQPQSVISTTDIINRIISGETMLVEDKGEHPYEMTPKAKIIWAMNDLPSITSSNDGIYRRFQVIKVPSIQEKDRDPDFKSHIQLEAPAILNWAIEGLKRLRQRRKFQIPESLRLSNANYTQHKDVARQFVNACCDTDPGQQVQSQPLYEVYKRWCENNGYKPESMTKMASEWKRLGLTRSEIRGRRYWKGIRLKGISSVIK